MSASHGPLDQTVDAQTVLRRRLAAAQTDTTRSASNEFVQPYQRQPPPRRGHPTRSIHLSITLLILAFVIVYAQRSRSSGLRTISREERWTGQGYLTSLPSGRYAICAHGGRKGVYTVPEDGGLGATECVVVQGKDVLDSGSLGKIRRKWSSVSHEKTADVQKPFEQKKDDDLEIIYLPPGYTMTPGLTDSHAHPLIYGRSAQLPLHGCKTIEEVVSRVEDFVRRTPLAEGAWVEGLGWDQNQWGGEWPTAADLDASEVLRGIPISLSRVDYHVEWVSPAILQLLGDIPDVEGGQVVRDAAGNPTGIFVDNAIDLITAIRPKMTDEDRERYLTIMLDDGMSKGLTGVHDAQLFESDLPFWKRMATEGKLPIRFYAMLACESDDYCGDRIDKVDQFDKHFTLRAVKLFADGALGSRGAALLEDYTDKPGWKGLMLKKEDAWNGLIEQWHQSGWQVNVHTIGDRAAHVVLDAIESAIQSDPDAGRDVRFRLEHAQIMLPADIERAAKLGVIGSYQPTHATSDMWYAEDRIGAERIKGAYAWRTYLNHGGRTALGSDFPVESIDPLKGFYAAITRTDETGNSPHGPGGWYSEQKLTREEALRGMTIDAAYASFSNITGSLTGGKRFDAVIWDDDLLSVADDEILDTRVKGVIVDGKVVWGGLHASNSQ